MILLTLSKKKGIKLHFLYKKISYFYKLNYLIEIKIYLV